jgi:protein-S-isoprenylcysteine O-methyltransferase Ste14
MALDWIDRVLRLAGGLLAYATLAILLLGIWHGIHRQVGRTTGRTGTWLHSGWFYLITAALFLGFCYLGWKPLPFIGSTTQRAWMLAFGALLYFPGLLLVIWARMALAENYFPSTGLGVQLFAGHRLVTRGPFTYLRHPMYAGIILAAFGSLLIYMAWTTLFLACIAPLIAVRARREEAALALEFGEQWQAYCRRVPMWLPKRKKIKEQHYGEHIS